jgi:hypothetical protein
MTRRVAWFAAGALVTTLSASSVARAEPPPPAPAPAGPAGPAYKNADLGIAMEGPAGWGMVSDKADVPTWVRLTSFSDPQTGAIAVLNARPAKALTLVKLRAEVTKAYADDASFKVHAVTDLPPSGKRPWPGLLLDAVHTRPADPPKPGTPPPPTPPPPVSWRVHAAYFLGGPNEYLLYVQGRSSLWAKIQPFVDHMIQGVTLKAQGPANAPKGEGSYRDDRAGFSCRFPAQYGIRIPDREQALVEFAPAGDGPVLGVFRYDSDGDLDHEAKALVDYYTGSEVGGEATSGTTDVGGRSAAFVKATARIGGRDQVFFVAVVQRGKDTFRLRVAADVTQETAAKATFDAFAKSFALTNQ